MKKKRKLFYLYYNISKIVDCTYFFRFIEIRFFIKYDRYNRQKGKENEEILFYNYSHMVCPERGYGSKHRADRHGA